MLTWRDSINAEMEANSDSWANVVGTTPSLDDEGWLDVEFDGGFGSQEGCSFAVWTAKWVYFPATYDGAEWATSVPRNPDGETIAHIGGG